MYKKRIAPIYVVGENVTVRNSSATGGTYGAFTYTSSLIAGSAKTPAPIVCGSNAAAGTGIANSQGNNVDNYSLYVKAIVSTVCQ